MGKLKLQEELACKCGCGANHIDENLIVVLYRLRKIYDKPINWNSGVRCEKHNKAEGGSETSSHLMGKAVDITCKASRNRFNLISAAFKVGINRIGIGKTFIHLDIDSAKPKEVIWLY